MSIRRVRLAELSEPIRSFLAQARNGEGILVADEAGRARYGVIPYEERTPAERKKAWKDIQRLQREVGKAMKEQGVTEEDVMRVILEDD